MIRDKWLFMLLIIFLWLNLLASNDIWITKLFLKLKKMIFTEICRGEGLKIKLFNKSEVSRLTRQLQFLRRKNAPIMVQDYNEVAYVLLHDNGSMELISPFYMDTISVCEIMNRENNNWNDDNESMNIFRRIYRGYKLIPPLSREDFSFILNSIIGIMAILLILINIVF